MAVSTKIPKGYWKNEAVTSYTVAELNPWPVLLTPEYVKFISYKYDSCSEKIIYTIIIPIIHLIEFSNRHVKTKHNAYNVERETSEELQKLLEDYIKRQENI